MEEVLPHFALTAARTGITEKRYFAHKTPAHRAGVSLSIKVKNFSAPEPFVWCAQILDLYRQTESSGSK